jgi:hypothetical protein
MDHYRNQHRSGSVYDAFYNGDSVERWTSDKYHRTEPEPLDMNHFQPTTISELEYGSVPSSFITDFTNSQSSSHMALSIAASDYPPVWTTPQSETTEIYGSLPTFGADTTHANSFQGTGCDIMAAQAPSDTPLMPLYIAQPLSGPLPVMPEPMSNEHAEPLGYALHHGTEPFLAGEVAANPLNSTLPYVQPTPVFFSSTQHYSYGD